MNLRGAEAVDRTYSLDEYERLPEEEGKVDLVEGRLVRESLPGAMHGWLVAKLAARIGSQAQERGLGIAVISSGFVLADDPPTVRGTDVAFIAAGNLREHGLPDGFWRIPPDLAVEVASPSNTRAEIREKVLEYLAAGTKLVWVVEPRDQSVTTYRSRTEVHRLSGSDILDGLDVLPGFRLRVADLFAPPYFPRR
jgi:Uma2 family endonuclease